MRLVHHSLLLLYEEFIRKETKQCEIDLASRKVVEAGIIVGVLLILCGLILISLILLFWIFCCVLLKLAIVCVWCIYWLKCIRLRFVFNVNDRNSLIELILQHCIWGCAMAAKNNLSWRVRSYLVQPSEEEVQLALRSGIVICNVINKIQPIAISKAWFELNEIMALIDGLFYELLL